MAASQKKNPTNGDIYKLLNDMNHRVQVLETWKISQDAGKAAVDEYRRQEATNSRQGLLNGLKDMLPYITLILAGALAAIYAYASRPK